MSGLVDNSPVIEGGTDGTVIGNDSNSLLVAAKQIGTWTIGATQTGTWNITNISGTISLPTGASTSALQTTGNTSLSNIDTKTPSLGQAVMASSRPVVIASNQSAIPVTGTFFQATQPVSGTVAVASLPAIPAGANAIGSVSVSNFPATQAVTQSTSPWVVSGTVTASAGTGTFAISASSLPLPLGASTAALQSTGNASLAAIDAGIPAALGQTTSANSMPVVLPSDQTISTSLAADIYTSYSPDYSSFPNGSANLLVDGSGRLETHSTILTDEGTFRDDFVGSSLTTSIGTVSFINNSTAITGTGFLTSLKNGQYVKKTADVETLFVRILSVDSDTAATLENVYTGTTSSAVAVSSSWATTTGTGASFSVTSSLLNIVAGTANGSTTYINRNGDYLPYVFQTKLAVSQRVANQNIQIGMTDSAASLTRYAIIQFDGTASNVVKFITAASSAASDTQTTTVTVSGLNTASQNSYQISLTNNQASLVINGKVQAVHMDHIPGPYDTLSLFYKTTNNAVVTSTTVAIDWSLFFNTDQVEISNNFQGEPQKVIIQGNSTTTGLPVDLQLDSSGNLIVRSLSGFGANFTFGDIRTAAITNVVVRRTTYTEQTTNGQRSIASASANDTAEGTGARTIQIIYFDQTGAGPFTETLSLNGTTGVNTIATNIAFIEKINVLTTGSGGVNAGIITLYTAINKGGVVNGTIAASDNQTFWAHHYIATGKICNITGLSVSHNGTTVGSGGVFTIRALSIGVSSAIENQVSDFHRLYGQSSTTPRTYFSPIVVAGPARLQVYVAPETTSSTVYRGSIDYSEQ